MSELLLGDVSGVDHVAVKLFGVGAEKRCAGRSGVPHEDAPFSRDVDETMCAESAEEATPEGSIVGAVVLHNLPGGGQDLQKNLAWVCGVVGLDGRDVEFLVDKPASRFEGGHQAVEDFLALGKVQQDEAGMNEIEGGFGQGIVDYIVVADFEVGGLERLEEARVDIGDEDVSGGTYTGGEPGCD